MGYLNLQQMGEAERAWTLSAHLPLGHHPTTGETFLTREADRFSGMYLLGVAGSGKSGELENLILADAHKGHSIIVIDPHGDLADNCMASLPERRIADTYVLDMLDEGFPFGINLFGLAGRPKTSKEKSQAVDRVMHVLEALWADVLTQQYLPNYVRTATIALTHAPGMTLLQMSRFLTDQAFRRGVLASVEDTTVHEFWRLHDTLSPNQQTARVQSLLNKLGAILIGRDLIQNIIGQQTTISFRRAIEHHEIIFIKLPTGQLEQDARLLGTIILAQISAALFSFGDLPERERPGFSLYVDEFQNFSTPDFARMFTEGRKFGMRVTLAHQLRGQLSPDLQDATASARTKLCFQLKADDAKEMAQYFPAPEDGRFSEIEAHATAVLLKDPGADKSVRFFTDTYLRPLQSQRKAGKIKLRVSGVSLAAVLWHGYDEAKRQAKERKPPELDDPTQYVDDLLRDVMQQRNPHLPIPPRAIAGFANFGFPTLAQHLRACPELLASYPFPRGDWMHHPHGEREHFLACVYALRGVMRALAANPLGKKAEASSSAVAAWLTQLPRRHALVRSGDDVGLIFTEDLPPRLEGRALDERLRQVRSQTRAKYCHPRDHVEHALHGESVSEESPITAPDLVHAVHAAARSRWTEVVEP